MFDIDFHGVNVAVDDLRKLQKALDTQSRLIVVECVALVERRAKQNFQGAHAPGERHVGGNKPNIVTGTARRSIIHEPVHRVGLWMYASKVGPTVEYARRLELGYPGGSGPGHGRTRPFPYLAPAGRESELGMAQIAGRRWAQALAL